MSEVRNDNLTDTQALLASRQADKLNFEIEKLKLEIENLQKKNRWDSVIPIIPPIVSVVTVALSIAGLFFGFWQFKRLQERTIDEQKHQRTERLEKQMRSDVDELSRFAQEKNQTLSRLSFLLDDLNIIRPSTPTNDLSPQIFNSYERTLTKALVSQIVDGVDLKSSQKDATFATAIPKNWTDYRNYLQQYEQQPTLNKILNNYTVALQYLRNKNPEYFDKFGYGPTNYFEPANFKQAEGQDLAQHCIQLLDGFKAHLDLMVDPRSQEAKTKNIRAFAKALPIKSIAQHVLGERDSADLPPMLP